MSILKYTRIAIPFTKPTDLGIPQGTKVKIVGVNPDNDDDSKYIGMIGTANGSLSQDYIEDCEDYFYGKIDIDDETIGFYSVKVLVL